ncbi:MAG: hypothetical protein Q9181_004276, partial [Wetmoreana brouardii]
MDDGRAKAFRMLKPPCVELSQVALRYKTNKSTAKELLRPLERLSETLPTVSRFLDAKLADYVFFPLSQILGESKRLPSRVLERALHCLRFLIIHGWRDHLSSEIGKELLILLAFLAGGNSTDPKPEDVDEDVGTIALECTASLFQSSVLSSIGIDGAISEENIPLLGHAVTVVLNAIAIGPATKVRLAACQTLDALVSALHDGEALRNFFPGTVSCLTKVLSSGIRVKIPYKLLEACIRLLDRLLCRVLGDDRCLAPTPSQQGLGTAERTDHRWVEATAGQVKMALSTIVPLQYHERHDVRDALFSFCISILTNCRKALTNCTLLMLETLVSLSSKFLREGSVTQFHKLEQVLASDPDLLDVLREALYYWVIALPRVVESNDETKRQRTIGQLSAAFRLLSAQNVDLQALNDLTVANLLSSVAIVVQTSSARNINPLRDESAEVGRILQSTASAREIGTFEPVVSDITSQGGIMANLQALINQLQNSAMSRVLERSLTESLRTTLGNEQIANLWITLQLLGNTSSPRLDADQWLNVPKEGPNPLAEEAYAFSLEILEKSTYDDAFDWRLQALSLEIVALQANSEKEDFRPELVDALYPILERMGSSNAALQQHAITCLSIVSNACGYPSASELVVDNADYLVNAVAVKLNTFDISPQASQVMLMMVRLCGSAVIPYLDDLIESIFAILACYHGYPRLVESLFEVLHAVVEEGGRSSPQAIEPATKSSTNQRQAYRPTTIADIVTRLKSMKAKNAESTSPPLPVDSSEPDAPITTPPPSTKEQPPPASKTHTLIHTITLQTSHHLSTPSPSLRRLLLNLITSSLPTLAAQTASTSGDTENQKTDFLPLLATLWPHITRQVFPSSSSTSTITDLPTLLAATQTLTTACIHGGSFLLSRCEDLFPPLSRLFHTLENNLLHEERTIGRARAERSLKFKTWDAM